jgi:hypothetical protein
MATIHIKPTNFIQITFHIKKILILVALSVKGAPKKKNKERTRRVLYGGLTCYIEDYRRKINYNRTPNYYKKDPK